MPQPAEKQVIVPCHVSNNQYLDSNALNNTAPHQIPFPVLIESEPSDFQTAHKIPKSHSFKIQNIFSHGPTP